MRFVISLFLSLSAYAAPIKVFHESNSERADIVRNIFVNKYKIPEELIENKQITRCEELRELGKLDLCLKNNGDLLVVSVDQRFVSESLKIFYAP